MMRDDNADARDGSQADDHTMDDQTSRAAHTPETDRDESTPLIEILSTEPRPASSRGSNLFARFQRRADPPDAVTVFTLENGPDRSMAFRLSGARRMQGPRTAGWQVDFGTLNVQMNDLGRFLAKYHREDDATGKATWRSTAQEIGYHLYRGLIDADPSLARQMLDLRRRSRTGSALTLAFAGPRDYLSVPYELLYDGQMPFGIQYPLCRQIIRPDQAIQPDLPTVMARLRAAGSPLSILLVSSGGWLIAADEEVYALHDQITAAAARAHLNIKVDVLLTGSMTLDDIRAALRKPYHIIHYAGQVYHDRGNDVHSGLLFGGADEVHTGHALITMRELLRLPSSGATQLFFISACMGALDWGELVLVDHDHLGVMGELIDGGVPNVIGFRWHVTNEGRQRFAQHFYEHLLTAPFVPEQAAFRARQAVYNHDNQDETWLSPVLIVQHTYEGDYQA